MMSEVLQDLPSILILQIMDVSLSIIRLPPLILIMIISVASQNTMQCPTPIPLMQCRNKLSWNGITLSSIIMAVPLHSGLTDIYISLSATAAGLTIPDLDMWRIGMPITWEA